MKKILFILSVWFNLRFLYKSQKHFFNKIQNTVFLQKSFKKEILETLATVCLYLEFEGYRNRNKYSSVMRDHFEMLKLLSNGLKDKEEK